MSSMTLLILEYQLASGVRLTGFCMLSVAVLQTGDYSREECMAKFGYKSFDAFVIATIDAVLAAKQAQKQLAQARDHAAAVQKLYDEAEAANREADVHQLGPQLLDARAGLEKAQREADAKAAAVPAERQHQVDV
jgi:hypothetical protein